MVGLPPSGYRITAHGGHLAYCDGNKQAITPVGVSPRRFLGVSDLWAFCGRSALIPLCRRVGSKTGKNRRVAWAHRRENSTALVVLLPTVADCTHVVSLIIFGWGAKHLSRFSRVSNALFTGFRPDFDDTTESKQNAPISEMAEKHLGDTPTGVIACLFPSQYAKCPS
jgi:hypothetical protein